MGSLFRELYRQSLLIAARDELGLSTRDESLGESVPETESPTSFPFELQITIGASPNNAAGAGPNNAPMLVLNAELSRVQLTGKRLHGRVRPFQCRRLLQSNRSPSSWRPSRAAGWSMRSGPPVTRRHPPGRLRT